MATETPTRDLHAQAKAHRSRGARRPIQCRNDAEIDVPCPDQLDMFPELSATATTEEG